jgi:iron(III) transport system ATP-binding protein
VTHDQSEAMALSDRIAVMHLGELMQLGSPREVYTRPANRTVADFMGLVNLIPARVVRAAGEASVVTIADEHRIAVPLPPTAVEGKIVQLAVRPENVRIVPTGDTDGVTATVAEATFLGNLVDCHVSLADGTRVRVQAEAGVRIDVGERIALHFDVPSLTAFDV